MPEVDANIDRETATTYYPNGSVRTKTDPMDQVTEFEYDRNGRITEVRFEDETRDFEYDRVGNVTNLVDLNGETSLGYDSLYRVIAETRSSTNQSTYVVSNFYDRVGNRTKCVYPDTTRELISQYDARNLLTMVDAGTNRTTYAYDKNGNQLSCLTTNGVVTVNYFDAMNRVTTRTVSNSVASVYSSECYYDLVGNRTVVNEVVSGQGGVRRAYEYDDIYRLTKESWSKDAVFATRSYSYDSAGNRTNMAFSVECEK